VCAFLSTCTQQTHLLLEPRERRTLRLPSFRPPLWARAVVSPLRASARAGPLSKDDMKCVTAVTDKWARNGERNGWDANAHLRSSREAAQSRPLAACPHLPTGREISRLEGREVRPQPCLALRLRSVRGFHRVWGHARTRAFERARVRTRSKRAFERARVRTRALPPRVRVRVRRSAGAQHAGTHLNLPERSLARHCPGPSTA